MGAVFLLENDTRSHMAQSLASYVKQGFVHHSLMQGTKHPMQTNWYNKCSVRARAAGYTWVAFLDMDEFIVVLDGCVLPHTVPLTRVNSRGSWQVSARVVIWKCQAFKPDISTAAILPHV